MNEHFVISLEDPKQDSVAYLSGLLPCNHYEVYKSNGELHAKGLKDSSTLHDLRIRLMTMGINAYVQTKHPNGQTDGKTDSGRSAYAFALGTKRIVFDAHSLSDISFQPPSGWNIRTIRNAIELRDFYSLDSTGNGDWLDRYLEYRVICVKLGYDELLHGKIRNPGDWKFGPRYFKNARDKFIKVFGPICTEDLDVWLADLSPQAKELKRLLDEKPQANQRDKIQGYVNSLGGLVSTRVILELVNAGTVCPKNLGEIISNS